MMRSSRRFLSALILALVLLGAAGAAQAQDAGIIEGQVVNQTAGGAEIGPGLPVSLHVMQGDEEVSLLESSTDAAGGFRFEGLSTDGGLEYWPEVVYLGVPYSPAEPLRFGGGETALDTTVPVYETTDDEAGLKLSSVHFIAQSFGQALRISEIHLFGNSGDRTYVGRPMDSVADKPVTAFLPLPPNAVGVAFESENAEERFVTVEGGVYDTEPIPPGEEVALVFLSYHLMVTSDVVRLEREFAYPVQTLSGLVAQPGLELRSEQLAEAGPQFFQEQQYLMYATESLPAGAVVSMDLILSEVGAGQPMPSSPASGSQTPAGATPRGNQRLLGVFGLVLAMLAVGAATVYPLVGRRTETVRIVASEIASNPTASQILDELVELEEAFEAGEMDQGAYERMRSEKQRAIQSLWQ